MCVQKSIRRRHALDWYLQDTSESKAFREHLAELGDPESDRLVTLFEHALRSRFHEALETDLLSSDNTDDEDLGRISNQERNKPLVRHWRPDRSDLATQVIQLCDRAGKYMKMLKNRSSTSSNQSLDSTSEFLEILSSKVTEKFRQEMAALEDQWVVDMDKLTTALKRYGHGNRSVRQTKHSDAQTDAKRARIGIVCCRRRAPHSSGSLFLCSSFAAVFFVWCCCFGVGVSGFVIAFDVGRDDCGAPAAISLRLKRGNYSDGCRSWTCADGRIRTNISV